MSIMSRLPVKNLQKKPVRTVSLLILTAFLSFSILAGSMVISGLRSGLSSLKAKLGADIMVVPYDAITKADLENIILQGNPGYFYMDRSVVDKLSTREGVGQMSEQFFLASASSGCCSLAVQIIGFDPETDFTIQPWIQNSYKGKLGYMEILVGNDLNAFAGDTLTFYGSDCQVAAKLTKTGTYLDTAVYATEETIKTLIESAKEQKLFNFGDVNPDEIVSCVLINVADGYSVEEVLDDINIHVRKVEAVRTQNLISDVASQLTGASDMIGGLVIAVWVLGLVILAIAFLMIAGERKNEYAILRVVGVTRKGIVSMLFKEALIVSAAGSLIGAACAVLVTMAFGNLIENTIGLPFLLPAGGDLIIMIAVGTVIAIVASALASCISALRISRTDTALILRGEN